jgi:DNA-binding IclR family transcriptional regulator
VFGPAAPIFNRSAHILGSVGIIGSADKLKPGRDERLAKQVIEAAGQITERISAMNLSTDRTPRAIG